jgi:hypothetical protein
MKTCSRCREAKEETEFNKDRQKPDGLFGWCKKCHAAWSKEYRAGRLAVGDNPTDKWRRNNQERHREHARRSELKKLYGITPEEYDELLASQNGVCAICSEPDPNGIRLPIDHDHNTGRVRGLLCTPCNRALGGFKDNPALLRSALTYLEESSRLSV